jgi:hypothetical protein
VLLLRLWLTVRNVESKDGAAAFFTAQWARSAPR